MVKEFEQLHPQTLELSYDQGRDTIIQITKRAFALGEKQPNAPFIITLWGEPNSGKSHLSQELINEFSSAGQSILSTTDYFKLGTSAIPHAMISALDVLIIQDLAPAIGRVRGNIVPYISRLKRIPDLRVQMYNPNLGQLPYTNPFYGVHIRILNSGSIKKP